MEAVRTIGKVLHTVNVNEFEFSFCHTNLSGTREIYCKHNMLIVDIIEDYSTRRPSRSYRRLV